MMEWTIQRDILFSALQNSQGIAEKNANKPILQNVLLSTKEQKLICSSSNLEQTLATECDAEIIIPGSITVDAKKLFELLKELRSGTVSFKLENQQLMIHDGRFHSSLATEDARLFPSMPETDFICDFNINAADLSRMIHRTLFACSQDDTRKYLTGSLLDIQQQSCCMVSTDGHRLALSKQSIEQQQECSIIVPKKSLQKIYKIIENNQDDVHLSMNEQSLCIRSNQHQLWCQLIDARYPQYQQFIPEQYKHSITVNRLDFDRILRRVMVVADVITYDVHFHFHDRLLTVYCQNDQSEKAEDVLDLQQPIEDCTLCFNARYLRQVFAALDAEEICMYFGDHDEPMRIEALGDDSSVYIIMPLLL